MPRRFRFYVEEIIAFLALLVLVAAVFLGSWALEPDEPPHDDVAPTGASEGVSE